MGEDSRGYGGLGGGSDVGGGLSACRTQPGGVGDMLGDAGELPEYEVIH